MENIDEVKLLKDIIFRKIDCAFPTYKGKLFYNIYIRNYGGKTYLGLELSNVKYRLKDIDYVRFAAKFEADFPEYYLCEEMESVYSVYFIDERIPDIAKVREKLKKHPDYERGNWGN